MNQISKMFDNKCKVVNASQMTEVYYVRITSPREGTRIKVNENTDRLMRILRHRNKV
ncbi:hypothetical protein HanRHA438_Chr07g0307611 [Helianthus annuus]|nr:hypothetical protein HanOQP8_Chr07g0251731 [Helianthus annuus]KAJ0908190.1 hypothetical protein HanRHA438_Chr07g0307611 [Helianthus annuus]